VTEAERLAKLMSLHGHEEIVLEGSLGYSKEWD